MNPIKCNQKNQRKSVVLMFLFAMSIVVGFGFLGAEKVHAAIYCGYMRCDTYEGGTQTCYRSYETAKDDADCSSKCKSGYTNCTPLKDEKEAKEWAEGKEGIKAGQTATEASNSSDKICKGLELSSPITWFNCFLLVILRLLANLMEAVGTLFAYVVAPANFLNIADNKVIYEIWTKVRDTLNVAFILTLLFSAFATVFQVDKFNYKNILRTLIIMALLVNFSFPIARAIIDFSNVLMYYFLNGLQIPTESLFAKAAETSALGKILYQNNAQANTSYLLASVIFSFIFVVTIFVITILFLIRTIALAILIIFSPVAFVGSIVPFLSSHASKWWTNLFNYSFFGPVMVFMIYIATQMMAQGSVYQGKMEEITRNNGVGDPSTIAAMAFFAIPIVILWIGIGTAQNMSIAFAGAVVGRGEKFMKWAGRGTYKAPWAAIKKTGAPGAAKQYYDQWKREGILGSERQAQREAWMGAKLGVKGAEEKDMKRRAEEYKKQLMGPDELKELALKGDAAAAYRLFEDNDMDDKTYNQFMQSAASEKLKESVSKKSKQNRADFAIKYKARKEAQKKVNEAISQNPSLSRAQQDTIRHQEEQRIKKEEISKLGIENWQKQNWKDVIDNNPDLRTFIRDSFMNLPPEAKTEIAKTLSDEKATALRGVGVPI